MRSTDGPHQVPPDVRVCFFGDSFVAGVGDTSGLGWVGRVTVAALAAGHRLTSYNLGVRRDTSTQVAARIPVEAPPRLAGADDSRLVLSAGVNDTTEVDGHPRASVEETVEAVAVALRVVGRGRLLVVGPPATADTAQNERIVLRDHALRTEADRLGVRFLSSFGGTIADPTWQREVAAGDGFHPDAGGYRVLAAIIEPVFLDWLRDSSTPPRAWPHASP